MTKQEISSLFGDFTWDFGQEFYITTSKGNFIWSDPDYNGSGQLKSTTLTYREFIGKGYSGRSKGNHNIGNYCGDFSYDETPEEVGVKS